MSRSLEYLTINTSLQPLVEAEMSIYGLAVDITKDRLYKVGKQSERSEMARNTILAFQKEGRPKSEIVNFLLQLNLSPEEIKQAFDGLEENKA